MSVRLRLGPFSVSSRGRVGVRVGPVSVNGGGRGRKRSYPSNTRRSSRADFERQIAEGDRWFREQAAAKRRATLSAKWQALFFAGARIWHRRGRATSVGVETEPTTTTTVGAHAADLDPSNVKTLGDETLTSTAARPLSPETLEHAEFVTRLRTVIDEARLRETKPPHVLLLGSEGAGKTTLVRIVAHELGAKLVTTTGPALRRPGDLAALLYDFDPDGIGVLFIDQLDRMPMIVEEVLCEALEDGPLSITIGSGLEARAIMLDLPPLVVVAATTKLASLSQPVRDRFGFHAATP